MGLLRVWMDRKAVSPRRAKRGQTTWMIVGPAGVGLVTRLPGRSA